MLQLDGKNHLDTEVLSLLHELAPDHDLMHTKRVDFVVGGVGCLRNVDLPPLAVGGDLNVSLISHVRHTGTP